MALQMLDKKKHTDEEKGFLCRYVRSNTETFKPHYHNYYEIFMVMKGSVCHIVNSKEYDLVPGQLLFIRDFDVHYYKSADKNHFEFLNISFTKETFDDMYRYLGKKFPAKELLSAKKPPCVFLSEIEREKMLHSVAELGNASLDKETEKIKFRALLLNIFMQNFFEHRVNRADIPLWLEMTYEKMKQPANFIEGSSRLYEICPYSREHLSRSLKKYYNTTIHDLVNDLRLGHCVKLLTISNLTITEVCYECGFENISWFYKLFEKKYGLTPSLFRKKYNRI